MVWFPLIDIAESSAHPSFGKTQWFLAHFWLFSSCWLFKRAVSLLCTNSRYKCHSNLTLDPHDIWKTIAKLDTPIYLNHVMAHRSKVCVTIGCEVWNAKNSRKTWKKTILLCSYFAHRNPWISRPYYPTAFVIFVNNGDNSVSILLIFFCH